MFKKISLILSCFFIILSLHSCNKDSKKDKDALFVGTNAEFPPFSFRVNGEIQGFDIDIAKEVGSRLNKKLVFKDMPFDALLPDLVLKNIDFIAAGMTCTQERAQRVYFTTPYITSDPLVILTLTKSNFPADGALEQLQDKTIVVNEGYTADLFLSAKDNLKLLRLASPADAFLALKHERAFAFVTAKSTLDAFLTTQDLTSFQVNWTLETDDNYALVISKGNTQLQEEVQKTIKTMLEDGTIDKLKTKWKLS